MHKKNAEPQLSEENRSPKTMLPISEVASRLGVSLSLAHKLVRSGEIASYRIGRCRRVSERQLQTYIDGCLVEKRNDLAYRKLKYF